MKMGIPGACLLVGIILARSSTIAFGISNVVAWGMNDDGQTDVPAGLSNVVAVSAGNTYSLALREDGTVAAWGNDEDGQATAPPGLSNVVSVSAGMYHSLALRADGTVIAWGSNTWGLTTLPAGLSNVVAVSAGRLHNLALRADGTVVAWGNSTFGQATVPPGLSNVVAISAGGFLSLVLSADGTISVWGTITNLPPALSNAAAVAAGSLHGHGLRADGRVFGWGYGGTSGARTNVPASLNSVEAIEGGDFHTLALRTDGTVASWGENGSGQTNVPPGLSNVVAVSAGGYHSLALVGDGPPRLAPMVQWIHAPQGGTVFMKADPVGARPLNCRWQKDGTLIDGATNVLLMVAVSNASCCGVYRCVVSNVFGIATGMSINVLSDFSPAGQQPYNATYSPWPGAAGVEFENFDRGGSGVAYGDTTATNQGGVYRIGEGVDIAADAAASNGYTVGWTLADEWLEYTAQVSEDGTYDLEIRVANAGAGATCRMFVDGIDITGSLSIPNTGAWNVYQVVRKTGLQLKAGAYVFRFEMNAVGSAGFVGAFDRWRLALAGPLFGFSQALESSGSDRILGWGPFTNGIRIQHRQVLNAGEWAPITGWITGQQYAVPASGMGTSGFYRIEYQP